MIATIKETAKRHWPALRLRSILLGTLLLTAALPGVGALFLRVYENTLVRQTEAELVAQGAALTATAQTFWGNRAVAKPRAETAYRPEASMIDLRTTPVLGDRAAASNAEGAPSPEALGVAARMGPIIATTQMTTLASIQLIDTHGTVIWGHEHGGSYAAVPEVAAALQGRVSTVLRRNAAYSRRYAFEWLSRASSLRIHHVRPIFANGRVVGALLLSRSPRALFRGLYEDRGKILLGIGLIFGLLLVFTGLLSRGIARPIATLGKATRELAMGEAAIPETPATAAIEIRELFENFRAMAVAIERRSRYLHDFAASVSHEFKTPLAGIRGAVELLEDHGATMSSEDRARFLANIADDAAHLSQLVTRLLDLARADMARPETAVSTDPVAVVRLIGDAFDSPEFAITIDARADGLHMALPAATLEAALTTLLENARQSGASAVCISISAEPSGLLCITVTDNGPGILASDRERLFELFFTTRRDVGGTGLGLAIARSLLGASHATLQLLPGGVGATFKITAPAALSHPPQR